MPSVMPTEFNFNQSSEQMFYFFINGEIGGESLDPGEDWIAAFRDDVCVGARQWTGIYTDIPVMGNDGEIYSEGYMEPGEYPTFRIYDNSTGNIYDTVISNSYPFNTAHCKIFTDSKTKTKFDKLLLLQRVLHCLFIKRKLNLI